MILDPEKEPAHPGHSTLYLNTSMIPSVFLAFRSFPQHHLRDPTALALDHTYSPTSRANILRRNRRQPNRLLASPRSHIYHVFERAILPNVLSVLQTLGHFLNKSRGHNELLLGVEVNIPRFKGKGVSNGYYSNDTCLK
jgi:hypothetical protein